MTILWCREFIDIVKFIIKDRIVIELKVIKTLITLDCL